MGRRDWSDLPRDILSSIADQLGLIELLGFRGVCKDWYSSSSSASALIESSPQHEPWLLLYATDRHEQHDQCTLYTRKRLYRSLRIPEMLGATCIASNQGWLLLFKKGSVFFFCPFSHARIDLPNFPQSEISSHVAAFSAPPTSLDCVVSVLNCSNGQDIIELKLLKRGEKSWTELQFSRPSLIFNKTITCASFYNGVFCFLTVRKGLLTYKVNDHGLLAHLALTSPPSGPCISSPLSLDCRGRILKSCTTRYYQDSNVRELLGWGDDISVSICGTRKRCCLGDKLIANESVEAAEEGKTSSSAKGVWIEPRFFQVPPDQSW